MSYDILQQPTNPNVSGTPLVYSVSSSNAGQPQFRYVFNVSSQFGFVASTLTPIKVYPNQYGIGTVDLSGVGAMYDTVTSPLLPGSIWGFSSCNGLSIEYGEEYAADFNTTPSYYYRGDLPNMDLLGGYKNINDDTGTGYNFDSGSYVIVSGSVDKSILSSNPYTFTIGSQPTVKRYVPRNASMTQVSVIQELYLGVDVTILGYDSTDTVISIDSYSYAGATPVPDEFVILRTNTSIPLDSFAYPNITAVWSSITYYDVIISGTDQVNRYYLLDECDYNSPSFFSWRNEFGVQDSYFVSNPIRRTANVSRNDYDRTFVRYEDSNSSYNINNRGKRQYLTNYDYTYEVTTDWLSQEEANWLSGLFESPNVFVFNLEEPLDPYSNMVGIEIINSSYEVNNSTSRNKLFQYTIQYKHSLQLQDR